MPSEPQRKPSRTGSKRMKFLRPSATSRPRIGLALDTSVTRHHGQEPQQVFPEFVTWRDVKAVEQDSTTATTQAKLGLIQTLENRVYVRAGPKKSVDESSIQQSHNLASANATYGPASALSSAAREQDGSDSAPLHKRIHNLRPAPLDLSTDVSPSDRAIPIGIAIPSAALYNPSNELESALPYPHSPPYRQSSLRYGQEVQTPTIVITPAKEEFSPEVLRKPSLRRPTSSVYSRYTNGIARSQYGRTPPVPALPFFAEKSKATISKARESAQTIFEDEGNSALSAMPRTKNAMSICTTFDEDEAPEVEALNLKRKSSQAHLPTPRRSKGWWNVLTSPFSASPMSRGFFLRSPALAEEEEGSEEQRSILAGASDMPASDTRNAVSFASRAADDDELRSAPARDSLDRIPRPKRSDTAPGALDLGNADTVNIYRIPSKGKAADYYNRGRNFSSVILPLDEGSSRGIDDDWSPSHSVYRGSIVTAEKGVDHTSIPLSGEAAAYYDSDRHFPSLGPDDVQRVQTPAEHDAEDEDSNERAVNSQSFLEDDIPGHFPDFSGTQAGAARGFFTTPSEHELRGATPVRSDTGGASGSAFSPMSPSPILEDAKTARFISQDSSTVNLRQIDLRRMPNANGTGAGLDDHVCGMDTIDEKPSLPGSAYHSRNNSRGLGISDAASDRALLPSNQQPISEKGYAERKDVKEEGTRRARRGRLIWLLGAVSGLVLILLIVLLVLFVPMHHTDMPVQAQWLDLSGFPPLPTGIATVIGSKEVKNVNGCVNPTALWSCAVPPGEDLSTTQPDQPNFRFLIRYRSGVVPSNDSIVEPTNSTINRRASGHAAVAGALVRRSTWSSYIFDSSPPPPSTDDQEFLGRTTDNVSEPFNGEETPFYISLLDPSSIQSTQGLKLRKRNSGFEYPYPSASSSSRAATPSSTASTQSTSSTAGVVPHPALKQNNEPALPDLYPLASAQPLRLFNRGQETEHYGFYTYFDRSLYLSNFLTSNASANSTVVGAIESNVGLSDASAVCTWSQTRLLVQIWTRQAEVTTLNSTTEGIDVPAANSTANDMSGPGSFPYSVTITIDRHGGDASKKGVYCYGLDEQHRAVESMGTWIAENRGFDSTIINPASVPGGNSTQVSKRDSNDGSGIDGGSGGCMCQWQN